MISNDARNTVVPNGNARRLGIVSFLIGYSLLIAEAAERANWMGLAGYVLILVAIGMTFVIYGCDVEH